MGGKLDPRLKDPCANGTGPNPQLSAPISAEAAKDCKRESLAAKVKTPDVLVQPHMASLEMVFYPDYKGATTYIQTPGRNTDPSARKADHTLVTELFPKEFQGTAFAAEHGSWNRANRAGYEVISIPMKNGHATGEYDDFLTGFVTRDGQVWGRPVGVTVGNDGSLYVTDDGSRSVWRVTYTGTQKASTR
jgi:glucose/arabinose dehydrogenase